MQRLPLPHLRFYKNRRATINQLSLRTGQMTKRRIQLPPRVPKEYEEQVKLVKYLDYKGFLFYHCPNGGSRDMREAVKFKRLGVKSGVPDICIPMPSNGYHGCYIELKRKIGGNISLKQRQWVEALKVQGYAAYICKGADDAIQIIDNYFKKGAKIDA